MRDIGSKSEVDGVVSDGADDNSILGAIEVEDSFLLIGLLVGLRDRADRIGVRALDVDLGEGSRKLATGDNEQVGLGDRAFEGVGSKQ